MCNTKDLNVSDNLACLENNLHAFWCAHIQLRRVNWEEEIGIQWQRKGCPSVINAQNELRISRQVRDSRSAIVLMDLVKGRN